MGKISFKALIRAVFYAVSVIALSGCIMEPVNLTSFVEDDEVVEIIEKGSSVVKMPGSDAELVAGNGKISNLDPNKYYIVEEWDKDSNQIGGPQFVSSNGTRGPLAGIGRVSPEKRELTGLTNSHQYLVKSAQNFEEGNTVSYYDLTDLRDSNAPKPAVIYEGTVMAKPPDGGLIFFDFEHILPPAAPYIENYEIVKAPVTPPGPTAPVTFLFGNIFTEAPAETEADFVFFDSELENREHFYVLKVKITEEEPPEPPEPVLAIRIVPYVHPTERTITFNPTTLERSQAQAIAGLPSITATTTGFNTFGWYYNGNLVTSTATLSSTVITAYNNSTATDPKDRIDVTVVGSHVFTFIGIIGTGAGAVPYNGTFTIVIN